MLPFVYCKDGVLEVEAKKIVALALTSKKSGLFLDALAPVKRVFSQSGLIVAYVGRGPLSGGRKSGYRTRTVHFGRRSLHVATPHLGLVKSSCLI